MFTLPNTLLPIGCRRAAVDACEATLDISQSAPIPAIALFQLRIRDTLDFGVDLSLWLAANGNGLISNAVWSVAALSPKTPILSGNSFLPSGLAVVAVAPGVGALPGDAYWLDVTFSVAAVAATAVSIALPARTMVRRVNIIVVNG